MNPQNEEGLRQASKDALMLDMLKKPAVFSWSIHIFTIIFIWEIYKTEIEFDVSVKNKETKKIEWFKAKRQLVYCTDPNGFVDYVKKERGIGEEKNLWTKYFLSNCKLSMIWRYCSNVEK